MSSSLQPRGPLPARVYWIRRLVVVAVVVLLVVVLAKLLGGSSDGASESATDGQAATVSAGSSQAPGTAGRTQRAKSRQEESATKKTPALARPDGPCEASDVLVKPKVGETPEGGRDVVIRLRLRTQEAEACTWQVSSDTVTLAITSGSDDIWTSRECPKAIPTEDVVVRRAKATTVPVTWNAKRSDDECSDYTDWAMPGWYHVKAAALSGEPTDVQFELVRPVSATITKTITPKPKPKPQPEKSDTDEKQRDGESEESTEHRPGDDGGGNSEG